MKLNSLIRPNGVAGTSGQDGTADSMRKTPRAPAQVNVQRVQDLEMIMDITQRINTSLVVSDVLSLVINHAIRITHAERGFLMLADKEGVLRYVVGHDRNGKMITPDSFQVSDSILDDVFRTGESICIEDALHDERFEERQSIIDLELETIMCAPLKTNAEIIGVIYVDSKFIQAVNRDEVLHLFEILAGQAATAIQNAKLFEDLRSTYEELREANEHIIRSERLALRGEMAAEVSHELNNILTIAMSQAAALGLFIRQADRGNSERYLADLTGCIKRIGTFSENLLVRSSLKSELYPEQLNTLIANFASFVRSLKKFRNGTIVLDLEEGMPEVNVDKDQIQQTLLNLVKNAIEAYTEATITIRTSYDAALNTVHLSVSDNGPGLTPEVKAKIFVQKITTKPDGHGFGLPVCRKIVENHRGTISAESTAGEGTLFTILLPLSAHTEGAGQPQI